VNPYFDDRKNEISKYMRLPNRIIPTVRSSFPGARFTVNFTSEAASRLQSDYKDIVSKVDIISFTYYPLNPDFTVKESDEVRSDLQKAIDAAGHRQVLFQEIGCPSAPRLKSSEKRQAEIIELAFRILKENKDRVIAANILWMSDLPDALVEQFGQYYQLPNNEAFKAYLASWQVFEREAQNLARR
jgi:hypothetical protein